MAFTSQQIAELQTAYDRIQAGKAGAATPTNAGDVANVNYAMAHGWQPTINSSTNASNLNSVPDLTAPPAPTDTTSTAMAGFKAAQDTYKNLSATADINAGIPDLQTQKKGLQQQILDVIKGLGGKSSALTSAEASLGVPEQTKRLQELNTQIASKSSEFDKAIEDLSGSTGLTTTIAGKQGQLQRQKAVEVGALTSLAQAVQGNIALAKDTAQRTVDLEFEQKQNTLDLLKEQLTQNYEQMSAAEKKKADELNATLDLQQQALNDAKTAKSNIYDVMISAAKNGADNTTLSNIKNAKTPEDAIAAAGQFLQSDQSKPITKTVGKVLYQWDPATNTWKTAAGTSGKSTTTPHGPSSTISAANKSQINQNLSAVRGADGYVNPDDYAAAKNDWIQAGGTATAFDTNFKGLRNPQNGNYNVGK